MAIVVSLFAGGGTPLLGSARKGVPKDPYGDSVLLSRRQYQLELNGTPEQWRERAGFALRRAIARGSQAPEETISLPVSAYRGLGLEGLDELANALGWRLDREQLRFGAVALKPVSAPH